MKVKPYFALGALLMLGACATAPETAPDVEPVVEARSSTDLIREKYETIEYGQELSFVCNSPIYATGRLSDRPNLQLMWENYLYDRPEGIWGEIGGYVEINGNLPLDLSLIHI